MSPEDIQHFLVTYDVAAGKATVEEFGNDSEAALAAYGEREQRYRNREDLDIVLLGADSIETVKRTHSSYFGTVGAGFSKYFLEGSDLLVRPDEGVATPIVQSAARRKRRRVGDPRNHR